MIEEEKNGIEPEKIPSEDDITDEVALALSPEQQKKKKRKLQLLFALLFLTGLLLAMFPVISQYWYYQESAEIVKDFEQQRREIGPPEANRRIELAQAYNASLDRKVLSDPFSPREQEGRAYYAQMLEIKELIGYVTIERIHQKLPIYAGTNEEILQKGVGQLEGTSLPVGGTNTHSVLTAHRGLPSARLFTDLDQMQEGDIFFVSNLRDTLAYQVDQIKTVEPTALHEVMLVQDQDYVTLLTCTPYMVNSHRLLVRGHRIPMPPEEAEEEVEKAQEGFSPEMYLVLFLGAILVAAGTMLAVSMRKKKQVVTSDNNVSSEENDNLASAKTDEEVKKPKDGGNA